MQKYVDVGTQGTFYSKNLFIFYLKRMPASTTENSTERITAWNVNIEHDETGHSHFTRVAQKGPKKVRRHFQLCWQTFSLNKLWTNCDCKMCLCVPTSSYFCIILPVCTLGGNFKIIQIFEILEICAWCVHDHNFLSSFGIIWLLAKNSFSYYLGIINMPK